MRRRLRGSIALLAALLALAPAPDQALSASSWPALAVHVSAGGAVLISDQQLALAGWPLPLPRATIGLSRHGVELPLLDTGAGFAFVAEPNRSRWSSEAVYWLAAGTAPALRLESLPTALAEPLRWAPDRLYDRHVATADGDSWWAGELRGSATLSASLALAEPIGPATPLQLRVRATLPRASHALNVAIAGQPPVTLRWGDQAAGTVPVTLTLDVPAAPAGALRLELSLAEPNDTVLLDSIALPTRATPAQPVSSSMPRLAVPLPAHLAGADLLVLSHQTFLPALEPLQAAHAARGQRAVLVDVQAAYDAFSYGERDPEAIRALIRAARPGAVLLVGVGTTALRQPQPARPTFLPPYLVRLPRDGELACDSCYARLNAGPATDQPLPDLPIGRWPVTTLAEAQVLVEKTRAALEAQAPGAWRSRVLALADNDWQPDRQPDPAGSFTTALERGLAGLPRGLAIERLYYAPERAAGEGAYEPDVARLRCRLFRLIDGGRLADPCPALADPGVALWIYTGHGSLWQWASTTPDAPTPYLWYLYDADRLRNGTRLPIVLALTCLSGDFANPILQSNDERLLVRAGGGAAALLASSGEGVNAGHAHLLDGLLAQLYAPAGARTLGDAHLAGLRALAADERSLAFAFNLLGDPLVTLPFVPRFHVMLPMGQ